MPSITNIDDGVRIPTTPFEKRLRWQIQNPSGNAERWVITPQMALEMLAWNTRNRPASEVSINKYATQMKADKWHFTGVPIIFSKERLLDGQTRLAACVRADWSFEALVVFGAPDEAFAYIDIGKNRSAGDIFSIHGVQNAALISAATRWVYQYESGTISSHGGESIGHAALYEYYLTHTDIDNSVWAGRAFLESRLAGPSIMTAAHYLCSRKSHVQADEFFRKVGEGLGFTNKKDPAFQLHKRLIDNAVSQEKIGRRYLLAITIKAWNSLRAGRDSGRLGFGVDETFPKAR